MSVCAYNSGADNKCLHPKAPRKPFCPHIIENDCEFFSDHHIKTHIVGAVADYSGVRIQTKPVEESAKPAESLEKNVNHPKRYTKGKIECIDALESAVVGKTPEEAICVANVIKYLWRYEEKEPLRSLKSAEWYLKRLISKYEMNYADHG